MKRATIELGGIWEETMGFVRAEFALLAPLALLGFGVPMVAMLLAVPMDAAETGKLQPGPWMLWMLPCGFVSMLGSLAISALALTPGVSVGESLGTALRRVPAGLGLFLLYVGAQVVLGVPLGIAGVLEGGAGPISTLVYFACLALVVWLFVRVMPIWAVLADRPQSPWAAVRTAFRLTRSCYARLLLLRVVMAAAAMLALVVLLIPIGAISRLIGVAVGSPDAALVLSYVGTGVVMAGVVGLWTVYVARLYRRLEGVISGM
jgi:hypothetical protein